MRVCRENSEAIGRRDKHPLAHDHVAVAVAVRCRAEIGGIGTRHQRHQLVRPDWVRVGVSTAKVGQGGAVHDRSCGSTQLPFDQRLCVGACDRVHRVEPHGEARLEHRADRIEVKEALHQVSISSHRVDHLNLHIAEGGGADTAEVHVLGL